MVSFIRKDFDGKNNLDIRLSYIYFTINQSVDLYHSYDSSIKFSAKHKNKDTTGKGW